MTSASSSPPPSSSALVASAASFSEAHPSKNRKGTEDPKTPPKKGQKNLLPPVFGANMSHLTRCPPAFAGKKKIKTRSPLCFAELWAPTPEQKPRTPREKGEKKEEKMGRKSWVLKRTLNLAAKIWLIFKKKRISHYVFACFVHMGSKFRVLLSTRQHIYIYMLLCSISGRFFFANRFKNAFFFVKN